MVLVVKFCSLKTNLHSIVRNQADTMQVQRSRWFRANWIIEQIFGVANESCEIVACKRESLILDIIADKKLNAIAEKIVDVDKKQDIAADKKLDAVVEEAVDVDKRQKAAASK